MTGRIFFCGLIVLFILGYGSIFGFDQGTNVSVKESGVIKLDSVNIKQLLSDQIQRARAKESESRRIAENSGMNKARAITAVKTAGSSSAGVSGNLSFRIFILATAAFSVFLFVLWRRRKLSSGLDEKKQLKDNILKLRQEKVGRKSDSRLDSNREKLKLEKVFSHGYDDERLLVSQAKRLSVSVGELQLAQRIKSYETERV